jgi:hypothetical protein
MESRKDARSVKATPTLGQSPSMSGTAAWFLSNAQPRAADGSSVTAARS